MKEKVFLPCCAVLLCLLLPAVLAAQEGRFLFLEDFGDAAPPALPAGWIAENTNTDAEAWIARDFGGSRASACLRLLAGPTGTHDWVFSPVISMVAGVDYQLVFTQRVTNGLTPHHLRVDLMSAQTSLSIAAPIRPLMPVTNRDAEFTSATFSAPVTGDYYVGFSDTSPAGTLGLFLDQVILVEDKPDLTVSVSLERERYEGTNVFSSADPVRVHVSVKNEGAGPLCLNSAPGVGPANDPEAVICFIVTGPSGTEIPAQAKYELAIPEEGDFITAATGEGLFKNFDLNRGHYDLTAPGVYSVKAVYQNYHRAEGCTAWLGRIVSAPVTFEIQ